MILLQQIKIDPRVEYIHNPSNPGYELLITLLLKRVLRYQTKVPF